MLYHTPQPLPYCKLIWQFNLFLSTSHKLCLVLFPAFFMYAVISTYLFRIVVRLLFLLYKLFKNMLSIFIIYMVTCLFFWETLKSKNVLIQYYYFIQVIYRINTTIIPLELAELSRWNCSSRWWFIYQGG